MTVSDPPSLDGIFALDGPLARRNPSYERREGQMRMATLVERGIRNGTHVLVEAGTGVGKSFAYLVPALRSGSRVVVSTGTIALQEQLVTKDIPLVCEVLGVQPRIELLKGRSHYLCRTKVDALRGDRLIAASATMEHVWEWSDRTRTGDRAELEIIPPSNEWEQLDADADDCIGELCSRFGDCWYFARREAARFADILVVNHALFFADVASGGSLLPSYDVAILDEAHQCERWATDALTSTLSRSVVTRMMRKLHRSYVVPTPLEAELDDGLRALATALAHLPSERYPLRENERARDALEIVHAALWHLENWVRASWQDALRRPAPPNEAERRRDLALRAISAQVQTIERTRSESDAVSWAERREVDGGYDVHAAPMDVADFLRAELFSRVSSVVLTSATIAQAGSFAFVRSALGIDDADEEVVPSPFDYGRQARLYVAPPDCNPKDTHFARRAAPIVEEALDVSGGRAFVLFTSYARLRELVTLLRPRLPFPLRLQGEMPRGRLLEWFRTTPGAVLFATGTFWEGIDVVGAQLSCVIVDRLPFPSPVDPLVAARLAAIEHGGGSSFEEYMIPAAIVRLKQGFGRLIRSIDDRGAMILLDGRAAAMPYGTAILEALPPARRVETLAELRGFFAS